MSTGDGWTVHFLDEALGTVRAATTGKPTTVVASAIVMNAIQNGVGASGEIRGSKLFPEGRTYEVVAVDQENRLVTIALR
jgi:hypothetical protein